MTLSPCQRWIPGNPRTMCSLKRGHQREPVLIRATPIVEGRTFTVDKREEGMRMDFAGGIHQHS